MLEFAYRPLLQDQVQLLEIPAGPERFQAYLDLMTDGDGELTAPLPLFNPMAKPHVREILEQFLGAGFEKIAAQAVEEAAERLAPVTSMAGTCPAPSLSDLRVTVSLVVGDDLQGGWTDRGAVEYRLRREPGPLLARGMLGVPLWTSAPPGGVQVRVAVLEACYRAVHFHTWGPVTTLDQLLDQEGRALRFAGRSPGRLSMTEAKKIGQALQPVLDSAHFGECVPALFGDAAAKNLGLPALRIPPGGGLDYAAERAWWNVVGPEEHITEPGSFGP